MFFDTLGGLLRVVVVGTAAYLWLVVVLRTTGKRTLAQLNAFDFIVTVALGSTLATSLLSDTVAWAEGAVGVALLALLQLLVAWLSIRAPIVRRAVTGSPTLLLQHGRIVPENLRSQRIAEQSLLAAIRSSGFGDVGSVAAVVLETNGQLSVIGRGQEGSGSALRDVPDYAGSG